MHPYSININDKSKVYWIIVPLSLICGYVTNECLLKNLDIYQTYSWIADIPSSGLAAIAPKVINMMNNDKNNFLIYK